MVTLTRYRPSDGRVVFAFPDRGYTENERLIFTFGEVVLEAEKGTELSNSAHLFSAMSKNADGTESERTSGASVPQEIADTVEAGLKKRGFDVDGT
jgi:hypothetical protein